MRREVGGSGGFERFPFSHDGQEHYSKEPGILARYHKEPCHSWYLEIVGVNDKAIPREYIVAFIDILGSSQILMDDDDVTVRNYLSGMEQLYTYTTDYVANGIKMFSDNILIYSEDVTSEGIETVIFSVARIQWSVMKASGLFIRGGIVMGRLDKIPDESTDCIIGKAVVEAHLLESQTAIYPRVVVSQDVVDTYAKGPYLIRTDWDQPFVDYLQLSL